jgi:arylsulfatase
MRPDRRGDGQSGATRRGNVDRAGYPAVCQQPRQCVFAEHSDDAILTGTDFMTMTREGDWKLVHFVDCDEGLLFNLTADPDERDNLWDQPDQKAKRKELIEKILRWRIMSARKT